MQPLAPISKTLVRCFANQLGPMTRTHDLVSRTHDLVSRSQASLRNHLHRYGFSEFRHSRDMMLSCFQGASTSCPSSASPAPESSFTCNLCTEVDHPSIQNCEFFPAETLILRNHQTPHPTNENPGLLPQALLQGGRSGIHHHPTLKPEPSNHEHTQGCKCPAADGGR